MIADKQHPERFVLDCYSADDLPFHQHDEVECHLRDCATCRAHVDELSHQREILLQRKPPAAFARQVLEHKPAPDLGSWLRPRFTMRWLAAAAVAAIVIALVPVGLRLGRGGIGADTLRTMGGFRATVFLKQGATTVEIDEEARVRPGDAVRFHVVAPERGFVCVFFMDERGDVSWYIPDTPQANALEVTAGAFLLPDSARFDDSPAMERAFVVFRPHEFRPRDAADAIRGAWLRSESRDFTELAWLPPWPHVATVLFRKRGTL